MTQLAVHNARIYADDGFFAGTVTVDDGRILSLSSQPGIPNADVVIDAGGAMLLPGGIDMHVHFRDPGFPDKEDFLSGSHSAALGGITTVLDMPNTKPAVLDVAAFEAKRATITGRSYVNFGLIAAVDTSNLDSVAALAEVGAAAFKLFMYERRDAPPAGVLNDAVIVDLMEAVTSTGLRLHVHAENDDLIKAGRREARSGANSSWIEHLKSRRSLAEAEAISRAILFARECETSLHICHLSSTEGVRLVAEAKRRGQRVTAEVTPQHLLLDSSAYERIGADLVMVPPVRDPSDRLALAEALSAGVIDIVATDHAPHTAGDKVGEPLAISTGLVGVQWSYPLMLSEALAGRMTIRRVVDAMSRVPAELLGLRGRKGVIRPGADADFVIIEEVDGRLHRGDLVSKGKSTAFDGNRVLCRVAAAIVGGRLQVLDGRLVGQPTGSFVAPLREKEPRDCLI